MSGAVSPRCSSRSRGWPLRHQVQRRPTSATGWAELSRVEPGTAIVVHLTDGRRLERVMVDATADALNTVDLSLVSSRDRRAQILDLVREFPQRYAGPAFVEQDGTRIPITQRIDRAMIVMVSRPKSVVFALRTPVDWLLHYAGPCPNCDTAQTALTGQTPLPSPLPRKAESDPRLGRGALPGASARGPQPAGRRDLGAASAAPAPVASREVACRAVAAPEPRRSLPRRRRAKAVSRNPLLRSRSPLPRRLPCARRAPR